MTLNLSGPGTALEGLKEEPKLLPCFSSSFKFLQIREPHGLGFLGLPLTKNKDFLPWAGEEQKRFLTLHQSWKASMGVAGVGRVVNNNAAQPHLSSQLDLF